MSPGPSMTPRSLVGMNKAVIIPGLSIHIGERMPGPFYEYFVLSIRDQVFCNLKDFGFENFPTTLVLILLPFPRIVMAIRAFIQFIGVVTFRPV